MGYICSHPPCPTARCWCPTASSRLATALSPSQQCLFLNSCYFRNVGFPLWYAPAVPPELGGTTEIWGHAKKNFRRFAPEFVPPASKPCRRLCQLQCQDDPRQIVSLVKSQAHRQRNPTMTTSRSESICVFRAGTSEQDFILEGECARR